MNDSSLRDDTRPDAAAQCTVGAVEFGRKMELRGAKMGRSQD